ncbi:MAG: hypothetical protein AAF514_02980 [Verrucomicrobiota bacterium]
MTERTHQNPIQTRPWWTHPRLVDAVFVFLILLRFAFYWVGQSAQRPEEPLSVAAIYRDIEPGYHTHFSSIWHPTTGETTIKEHYGEGIRSFPFPSLLPHGILLGLFGAPGIVLADLIIPLLFYFLLRGIVSRLSGNLFMGQLFSLAISLQAHKLSEKLIGLPHFWGDKTPRPFVAELFFLSVLLLIIVIVRALALNQPLKSRVWIAFMASYALLIQCHFYLASALLAPVLLTFGFALFKARGRSDRKSWAAWSIGALAGLICLAPFVFQRLHEHEDIPRRMGVNAMSLGELPNPVELYGDHPSIHPLLFLSLILFVALVLLPFLFQKLKNGERQAALFFLGVAVLIASLSLAAPYINAFILGKLVIILRYEDAFFKAASYALLIEVCLFLSLIAPTAIFRRLARPATGVLLLLSLLVLGLQARQAFTKVQTRPSSFQDYRYRHAVEEGVDYRNLFSELVRHLEGPAYSGDLVLGSFDTQVTAWWTTYRSGFTYSPDPTTCYLPDEVLETRVLELCRLLGMSEEQFIEWSHRGHNIIYSLFLQKYHATKFHLPYPIDDYSESDQARIHDPNARLIHPFIFCLPLSEEKRLVEAYRKIPKGTGHLSGELDLLLVSKREPFRPDVKGLGLEKRFENEGFILYQFN